MCPVSVGRDDRTRVPRHPPHAGRAAEVRAGVGHQHQVLAPARRPRTLRQRRGRRAAHQEVELLTPPLLFLSCYRLRGINTVCCTLLCSKLFYSIMIS